ncbi:MAG: tyrosine-type recombinase/integrase [Deltaproteobacteria bacterium]|nr:tyrosine-type recombinase/integrase [Deltaproteobacteria bacterium]
MRSGDLADAEPAAADADSRNHERIRRASLRKTRPRHDLFRSVRFHDLRHTCASHLIMGTWGRAWRLEEVQVVLGHASRTTIERYARLAPDAIRRVANEAIEQWSDDSKSALGLVNDWSTPNSPYTQVPEKMEPPIRVELMTYGLRTPRCSQCFQEVRVPSDQSCPLERIEELIKELEKLIRRCPKRPTER